ncbi:hypothetical protein LSAT2_000205, partial [Lamellibrachia satsuma]
VSVCAAGPTKVTVTVPADVWEGDGAGLNCTTDVNKVDVSLLYWYKNIPYVFANAVYVYVDGYPTQTKAYNALENRAVGQWFGNVHQLYINKTNLTDQGTYFCKSGTKEDSETLTINRK